MTEIRTCEQCGNSFEPKAAHQRFDWDECHYQHHVEQSILAASQRVEHPLQLVREEQEQSKEKARWTLLAREHLARTLLETGYAHADDFDAISVPDDHRNVIGSQMGSFVQRGWMEEVGRRASANPKRKKAKSAIYQLTAEGNIELTQLVRSSSNAASSSGSASHVAAAPDSEQEIVGPTAAAEDAGRTPRSGRSGLPGDQAGVGSPSTTNGDPPPASTVATDAGSPDSLIQLDGARKAPSMFDPYEGQAA